MKTLKLFSGFLLLGLLSSSCYTEVLIEDDYIETSSFNTDQVLQSYDLWYVDINASRGNGEVPFLQTAFTISFDRGLLLANNNLVGVGKTGGGLGIEVGVYDPLRAAVEIDHDIDGRWLFEIFVLNNATLELYNAPTDTSYVIRGYQRSNFDYDILFYNNINYFLQEYEAWEKVYTSEAGAINDFDDENYLQFLTGTNGDYFRSSVDAPGTALNSLQWDFEGDYQVYDVVNDETLKTLTLDYDFLDNDYFELYVINDSSIELYHPDSETVYEFRGRGYIEFLKNGTNAVTKKRKKTKLPVMNVVRKRK
ncbi:nicotinic acid mononucleotide adenyltransferase [Muriicola sp. Z0-33]|uniref:nicotinic acid mononucleotide adenyltransferase n=1 Tax=Muriicola sp. Z0-33 TaxID=2816957 RepID=UPI0022376165|nr:nicotinic acid mononucleotide adenyltransferase [Muriicola sp. Z0-33]MCW5514884.1 nicotinic acid mononucleotide adenyltransferase [Muriicola sp. Z0-33]